MPPPEWTYGWTASSRCKQLRPVRKCGRVGRGMMRSGRSVSLVRRWLTRANCDLEFLYFMCEVTRFVMNIRIATAFRALRGQSHRTGRGF